MTINIYTCSHGQDNLSPFYGREEVDHTEIVVKTKNVFGKVYEYAEPATPGFYAFGGTFLYTSNSVIPGYTHPIPLHDRDMSKE